MGRFRWMMLAVAGLFLLGGVAWVILVKFEWEKPTLTMLPEGEYLTQKISLQAEDRKSGLAELHLEALQQGKAISLIQEQFPPGVYQMEKTIALRPLPKGLKDGEVQIRLSAKDHSWNRGNPVVLERRYIIDTQPPRISILGGPHYANQGGAGFVVFQSSEEIPKNGIQVGDSFFPGYPAGKDRYQAYFAIQREVSPKTSISVAGEDRAGNRAQTPFPLFIRPKKFTHDRIQITENFLRNILPYFQARDPNLKGEPIEMFLAINQRQRQIDHEEIQKICQKTTAQSLWSGPFMGLPNAKAMAAFGDERTYWYNGRQIDRQIHLGLDLASTNQSPVPAGNSGKVVFAGPLGIYGNTVILDHGFGLFSMYAHLSQIETEVNREVKRGETLGRTGATGMAGGDHLHFSILIHGVFVNPIEWLDPHWIKDNVERKQIPG